MSDKEVHSEFGGSVIKRVIRCPGSVALCRTVPPEPSSKWAAEGTHAHKVAEELLTLRQRKVAGFGDMADAINTYLDTVYADWDRAHEEWKAARGGPDTMPEGYVEADFTLPIKSAPKGAVFGKNDFCLWEPLTGRLTVYDYKHGAGVGVDVEDNEQLKFYALGAVLAKGWPVKKVELVIVQPRLQMAEPVKRWEMPLYDLVEFLGEIEEAVGEALSSVGRYENKNPAFVDDCLKPYPYPGDTADYCRWCPAAAICPAKNKQALNDAALGFSSFVDVTADALPRIEDLTIEHLGKILKGLDTITAWADQIRDYLFKRLQEGEDVPGWKLVEKVGRRKWADDETKIASYLGAAYGLAEDDIRPRKLVTLTQVETLVKAAITDKKERLDAKADIEHRFTVKESSGLTMVRDSDRRPGVSPADLGEAFAGVSIPDAL